MDVVKEWFLEAVQASLENRKVAWTQDITDAQWMELFALAQQQHMLAMVYEAVYACPSAQRANPALMAAYKRQTMQSVLMQAVKTGEFFALLRHLKASGIEPLVVKGVICRELYPNPDHRMSADEDLVVLPEQYARCHEAMLAYGMQLSEPDKDIQNAYEVPYGKKGSPIYIEVHKSLFPPESEAYGDFNRFFEGMHERRIEKSMGGVSVTTLCETDHFFYLIVHAFKHFLHSGFGVRQVCDIVRFANAYGNRINWLKVMEQCREIHAELFVVSMLKIGRRYFGFDLDAACCPKAWSVMDVDEQPMLLDLLDSGVYGDASLERKHSSTMTLQAVTMQKRGQRARGGVLRSIFPGREQLQGRYTYLKTKPYLLPIAWASRMARYCRESRKGVHGSAAESLRIGSERVELMRRYGIIR